MFPSSRPSWVILFEGEFIVGTKVVGVFHSQASARQYAEVVAKTKRYSWRIVPMAKRNPLREESYKENLH